MIFPAARNRSDLKVAWVIRWKNAKLGKPNDRVAVIIPSCLRVDRAIVFLRSVSKQADNLAIKHVKSPISRIKV